ncbi:ube2s [Scenedesmus sp. PABB004]|nr:ube2s [Scenedesmus sp. PABB004]
MLAPKVIKDLTRELQQLATSAEVQALGIRVTLNDADVTDIAVELDGPPGTPYEGGTFRMQLALPPDFPSEPPKGFFTTKIWHPNVSKSGEICVNVLKRDWKPDLGIRHVLLVIRCLLIEPYPESALNEEAGKALLEDYAAYAAHAALMTSLHAGGAAKRGVPLSSSGAHNAGSSGAGGGGEPGGEGSPAVKKARPEARPALSKARKSLKRL